MPIVMHHVSLLSRPSIQSSLTDGFLIKEDKPPLHTASALVRHVFPCLYDRISHRRCNGISFRLLGTRRPLPNVSTSIVHGSEPESDRTRPPSRPKVVSTELDRLRCGNLMQGTCSAPPNNPEAFSPLIPFPKPASLPLPRPT